MNYGRGRKALRALLVVLIGIGLTQSIWAQRRESGSGEIIPEEDLGLAPHEEAPVDLTGYWVSMVTEDWEWRMLTPPAGNYASVPVNETAKEVADQWDYDSSDHNTCLPYGAPGLIREPMRIRLSWDDDDTLRFETDNGMQTRLFQFDPSQVAGGPRSLQGDSVAAWDRSGMKVVTMNLAAGWLRKNGVPYSENIQMTEYIDRYTGFEDDWLTVTTILEDPMYLEEPWFLSTHFKRLPDDSSWDPRPCFTAPPLVGRELGQERE